LPLNDLNDRTSAQTPIAMNIATQPTESAGHTTLCYQPTQRPIRAKIQTRRDRVVTIAAAARALW
jgi:hypothetical protein